MQSFQGQWLVYLFSSVLSKVIHEKSVFFNLFLVFVIFNDKNKKVGNSEVRSSGILVACTYAKFLVTLVAVT